MKRLLAFRGKTTFAYLTITFILAFLPLCVLGGYVFNKGMESVTNEIAQSAQAQAEFFLGNLENDIIRIRELQSECLNDTNLQRLLLRHDIMDKYDYVFSINQLIYRLITIKDSNPYIKSVSIHSKELNKSISSDLLLDPLNTDHFENIRVVEDRSGAQFVNYQGALYLTTLRKGQTYRAMMENLVEIELDQDALIQALAQFSTVEGSGAFLVGVYGEFSLSASAAQEQEDNESFLQGIRQVEGVGQGYRTVRGTEYFYTYVKSDYLNAVLVRYFPKDALFTPAHSQMTWILLLLLLLLIVLLGVWMVAYRLIHKPLADLVKGFQALQDGDFNVSVHTQYATEFGYLCTRFNEMATRLRSLIDQVYKQKIMNQQSELKQLQSQINPHFLYNSFFTINTMARMQDENLITFSHYLGVYFQYITRNASPYVPLREEVEHTRIYVNIQRIRFSKRLDIQFEELPEKYTQRTIPRLMLQPILENAFEYVVEKQQSQGKIRVSFVPEGEMLCVIVEDNGKMLTDQKLKQMQDQLTADTFENMETTGMINIHRRIRLIYGTENSVGLTLERSSLGGLKVTLKIGG